MNKLIAIGIDPRRTCNACERVTFAKPRKQRDAHWYEVENPAGK